MHAELLVALDAVLEGSPIHPDLLPSLLWVLRRPLYAIVAPRTWTRVKVPSEGERDLEAFHGITIITAVTQTVLDDSLTSLRTKTMWGSWGRNCTGTETTGDVSIVREHTEVLSGFKDARQPHPKFVEPSYVVGPADGGPDV
jgi:hypothetical protein